MVDFIGFHAGRIIEDHFHGPVLDHLSPNDDHNEANLNRAKMRSGKVYNKIPAKRALQTCQRAQLAEISNKESKLKQKFNPFTFTF